MSNAVKARSIPRHCDKEPASAQPISGELQVNAITIIQLSVQTISHQLNVARHQYICARSESGQNQLNQLIMCVRISARARNRTLPCLQNARSENIFLLARFMNIFFSIINYASCFQESWDLFIMPPLTVFSLTFFLSAQCPEQLKCHNATV